MLEQPDEKPSGSAQRRAELTTQAVEYATHHGIGQISLRPLAAELGTSDRMLLYYFGSRAGLVHAICDALADSLETRLAAEVPPHPLTPALLLQHAWNVVSDPQLRPSLTLHLEIDVLAARGSEPFVTAAQSATAAWLDWFIDHLDSPGDQRPSIAAGLLAVIDGLLLQTAVHPGASVSHAHRWILGLLDPSRQERDAGPHQDSARPH